MDNSQPKKKVRIGDLLLENNVITEGQLMMALDEQKRSGKRVGQVCIDLGFVAEDRLLELLSQHLGVPFVDLRHYQFHDGLVKLLPESFARRFRAIPLSEEQDGVLMGMADPMDLMAIDEMQHHLNKPVYPAVVREFELMDNIDRLYRRADEMSTLASELDQQLGETSGFDLEALSAGAGTEDAPVVRLLQNIFEDAVQVGASDIHIEPDEKVLRVRLRIDGILHEQVIKETRISSALVLRLKIMSNLDISEKRVPQDGRFNIKIRDKSIDVRLSTMPVSYGESVVMRLLDQSKGILSFSQLGMPERLIKKMGQLIRRPHGMVLVTGPTGSGKTTTLYSALSLLNEPEKKIITVEDPVEYRLSRVTQVQVNPKVGLTFASVLRAALRQDPDIVLVGEMRDTETVEIGLRAALTGHFVLSTLHTNDAISTAIRLLDMGAEPFLAATALNAVIAQRLIRKVCDNCVQTYEPNARELALLRKIVGNGNNVQETGYVHGKGCHRCNNTGNRGRLGVYELLEMNDDLADALRGRDALRFTQVARNMPSFKSLAQEALDYALKGVVSLDEVFRLSMEVSDDADMEVA